VVDLFVVALEVEKGEDQEEGGKHQADFEDGGCARVEGEGEGEGHGEVGSGARRGGSVMLGGKERTFSLEGGGRREEGGGRREIVELKREGTE
jgi:hypothetical protein